MTGRIATIEYWDGYKLLWSEPMIFNRIFQVGDPICEKGKWYRVAAIQIQDTIEKVVLREENAQDLPAL